MPTGVYLRKPLSEETKRKIGRANKGKVSWVKGKNLTEEHKKKIGLANKFTPKPDRRKEKNPQWKGGKPKCIRCKLSVSGYKNKIHRKCRTGSFHPRWRNLSTIFEKLRKSPEYKLWRKSVFERDDYTCIWCGARSGNGKAVILHADHIKPFAYFPELRFAIDNGRTLCIDCHKTTDTYGSKIKKDAD